MLKATVTDYLTHLHTLEVNAGLAFKYIRYDMHRHGLLTPMLSGRLQNAAAEEHHHARLIRQMLDRLTLVSQSELMAQASKVSATCVVGWRARIQPFVRLHFVNMTERYFADEGIRRFHRNLTEAAKLLGDSNLAARVAHFFDVVVVDEQSHVTLGDDLLILYRSKLPEVVQEAGGFKLTVWQSPLMPTLRARNRLERQLKDIDTLSLAAE